MDKYLVSKKVWLNKINKLAYEGRFEKAEKIINFGVSKKFKLTKKDASNILSSCGIDVRYWFAKPLVDIGGEFPTFVIKYAESVIEDRKSNLYDIWNRIPDAIKGFELVIESSKKIKELNKQNGGSSYYYKYLKYKNKYLQLINKKIL